MEAGDGRGGPVPRREVETHLAWGCSVLAEFHLCHACFLGRGWLAQMEASRQLAQRVAVRREFPTFAAHFD
jgi:hypothetical protein